MGDVFVNWHDPHEACREMRRLDQTFNTSPSSPLHHDNRCDLLHTPNVPFEVLESLLAPVGWEGEPGSLHATTGLAYNRESYFR